MQELVRAVVGDQEVNVGRAYAEAKGLKVLDEPTHRPDGRPRPETRRGGRPNKPRQGIETTVAKAAAAKKAESSAAHDNPPSKEKKS